MSEQANSSLQLDSDFTRAILDGKLDEFAAQLEGQLARNSRFYLGWLFLARTRDRLKDPDRADVCYEEAARLAFPNVLARLVQDLEDFAWRHGRQRALDLARSRLGKEEPALAPAPTGPSAKTPSPDTKPASVHRPAPLVPPLPVKAEAATPKAPRQEDGNRPGAGPVPTTAGRSGSPPLLSRPPGPETLSKARRRQGKPPVARSTVEPKLRELEGAYRQGDHAPRVLLQLAQIRQRLGEYDKALNYLDEVIRSEGSGQHSVDDVLPLINLKAQILSGQEHWDEAAQEYQRLLTYEIRPAARRFHRLQLALMYQHSRRLDDARHVVDAVIKEDPQDLQALRFRRSLDMPADDGPNGDRPAGAAQRIYVSRLVEHDLQRAEFRDPVILEKGGKPTLADARRLLQAGEQARDKPGGDPYKSLNERYPLFLEAAKAFAMLPEGSYDPDELLLAVARFTLARGGALVWDFGAKFTAGAAEDTLRRLQDTIISYSLEFIDVQLQLVAADQLRSDRFVWLALKNLLAVSLSFTLRKPLESLKQPFENLFADCLASPKPQLHRVVWEALVAAGALRERFLDLLRQDPNVGSKVLDALKPGAPRQGEWRALLGEIRGRVPQPEEGPAELLQSAAAAWRERRQEIDAFFGKLEAWSEGSGFASLLELWGYFPDRPANSLLPSDRVLCGKVQHLLETLAPYASRATEEQTGILTSARAQAGELLARIEQAPTYWGRVGFEPLLTRLRAVIERLEQRRAEEMAPQLRLALEPPVFHLENGAAVGGVMVTNHGQATAPRATLSVELWSMEGGRPLWQEQVAIADEIPAGAFRHVPLRIPESFLAEGSSAAYRLNLHAGGESAWHQATLEIGGGIQINPEAIPWDETREPGEAMFKGRDKELDLLGRHLKSSNRAKSYMLYGLTRMGKSSLLSFLARRIDLQPTEHPGPPSRFFCVEWNFARDANNKKAAMWRRFLGEAIVDKAQRLANSGQLPAAAVPHLRDPENPDFDDWDKILKTMRARQMYPVFLVDEFTYYKQMANLHLVEPSFLAAIREFAIQGLASFIFAGTYDLRELLQEKKYGITGQLVNVEERRVSQIDEADARNLIVKPMPELKFTEEAVRHILHLTFRIPYFVQLLCRRLALFAAATRQSQIGYPEVERVVLSLIDDEEADPRLGIDALGPNVFMNNMHHPQDPPHHHALLTTLCDHLRGRVLPVPMPLDAIKAVWQKHGVPEAEHLIAHAVKELKDRQVLVERAADGRPTYQISVDLFRRWWANEHRFLETDLDLLKSEESARKQGKAL